jgi:hypothetical protein
VHDRRADEVVALLNTATEITLDAAGRLVLTMDGVASTIDGPLENLAMYVALVTTGTIPGVTDLPGTEYDFLVDGRLSRADLAAATDKSSSFTTDEIAYIDGLLGINLESAGDMTWSAVDCTDCTYDRSDTFADATASVLVRQTDGTYLIETVNICHAVFGAEDLTASGTLAAFTEAADDARSVINFGHEYAVPAATTN